MEHVSASFHILLIYRIHSTFIIAQTVLQSSANFNTKLILFKLKHQPNYETQTIQ